MSEPVNLNRYRKEKARVARRQQGDENAVRFGLTKEERALDKERAAKARRDLDGHETEA